MPYELKGKAKARYIMMADIPECPMCGRTEDIRNAPSFIDKGMHYVNYSCKCGTRWQEQWKLVSVTLQDNGREASDGVL